MYAHPTYQSPYMQSYYMPPPISPLIPPVPLTPVATAIPLSPGIPIISLPPYDPHPPSPPKKPSFWKRARANSWSGGHNKATSWAEPVVYIPAQFAPSSPPAAPPLLLHAPALGHGRTHSWGATPPALPIPLPPWQSQWSAPPIEPRRLHPLLSARGTELHFDLSSAAFDPRIRYATGTTAAVSPAELEEPATAPPLAELTVLAPAMPQWPIDLRVPAAAYAYAGGAPPVVRLRDVLEAVHRALHTQVSHTDWARLSASEVAAVSRAYHRRVAAARAAHVLAAAEIASQGVKRVDFLLGRAMFRGLAPVRAGDGTVATMQLVTSA